MYPTFFRMVPGYQNSNLARCHLISQFNWTRVGTLKQSDDPRFALVSGKSKFSKVLFNGLKLGNAK